MKTEKDKRLLKYQYVFSLLLAGFGATLIVFAVLQLSGSMFWLVTAVILILCVLALDKWW